MTTSQLSLRSFDIPQIHRFGVGFDRILDALDGVQRLSTQNNSNYPPYNIVKYSEDKFAIEIAVAGFKTECINIHVESNILKISSSLPEIIEEKEYVHKGISGRNFERVFTLAEHVEVTGAIQENGILTVSLERIIPEEKKAKKIAITYVK